MLTMAQRANTAGMTTPSPTQANAVEFEVGGAHLLR